MAPENTAPGLPADVPVGQPEHVVDLAFQVPDGWRAEPVDGWLRQVLDVAPGAAAVIEPGIDRTGEPASFLHRALAIALELMRVANVPVFQPARVLALHRAPAGEDTARPHRWSARIALPTVDLVSRRFSEAALSEAFGACARLARTPISPDTVGAFARRVQSSLVKPFAAAWTAGKSTLPLLRTVHARGVPFFHLGRGIYQIGLGARARRVDRSTIEFDSAIGARLSRDKGATAELLRLAGLPAPRHLIVRDVEHALKAAAALGWPVVVKPADRERGEGVQVDVDDAERLRAAFADAAALSATRRVIVERQVAGVCHRLFVARGRLLYAVARHPASVIGDGVSSVRELAEAHAAREALLPPWRRSGNAAFDTLARAAIAGAGFDESSVPAAGRRVPLRRIESTEWGGVDEDVTARVHPDNLRVALDAAALFGLEVAGIDVITTDIGLPWHRSGAIVTEVNYAPLLGGGEISRACIPEFIDRLLGGDGRIPVELFVGGPGAWSAASRRRDALAAEGLRAWATRADETIDATASVVPMAVEGGALRRARAVALRRDVDALVIAAAPSESIGGRWPIECLDRVVMVDA